MTDITRDNIFKDNEMVPRLRRILDEGPALPGRALDHELAPFVPPAERTGAELIADQAIAVVDQTLQHALTQLPPLRERLDRLEQRLLAVGVDTREHIRAQLHVVEACLKGIDHIDRQIEDAEKSLASLTGRGQP